MRLLALFRNSAPLPEVTWPGGRVPACLGSGEPVPPTDGWVTCPTCGHPVKARTSFTDHNIMRIIMHAADR